MQHHTKFKGDIGLTQIIAKFTKANIDCLLPISEHLPFDLVVCNESGKLLKIQVRFTTEARNYIPIKLRTTGYNNTQGMYSKSLDKSKFDGLACYCPDTDQCYFMRYDEYKDKKSEFCLSLKENSAIYHLLFIDPNRLF